MQLKAESEKPERSSSHSSKPAAAEIYRELSDIINHQSWSGHPEMAETFLVYRPERGPTQVLEKIGEGLVRYSEKEHVAYALIKYISMYLGASKTFALTYKMALDCVYFWMAYTAPVPEPVSFASKSYDCLTFHRLPFDLVDNNEPTLSFDSIFQRMDQPEVVMCWLGSLFVHESDRSSYLWIFGHGGDGKGRLAHVLHRLLGPAYRGAIVPESAPEKRFWSHSLLGKRLVVFGDCNNYSFPMSGLFKSITGGDAVTIDPKGQPAFDATVDCKFLFLSNERPSITGGRANLRRAVYVEMRQLSDAEVGQFVPTPILDGRLWAEAPAFFGRCVSKYLQKYPDHRPILGADESLQELVNDNEEWLCNLTDKYLRAGKGFTIASSRMQEIRVDEKLPQHEYRNWIAYLKRNYDIKQSRTNSIRYWTGIRGLTPAEEVSYVLNKNSSDKG